MGRGIEMPSTINSNLSALFTQNRLRQTDIRLAATTSSLSSGLRVQRASDDAAGLAISTRLSAAAKAGVQLSRNLNDGISLVQTADGGLQRIQELLQRARELAVQAASGAYRDTDRSALDQEFSSQLAEIDRIAAGNEAFGIHLLQGNRSAARGSTLRLDDVFPGGSGSALTMSSGIQPVAFIPAGATDVRIDIDSFGADDDLQLFTTSGRHLVGTALTDVVWVGKNISNAADMATQVLTEGKGFDAGASYDAAALLPGDSGYTGGSPSLNLSYNGMQIQYSGDGDHADGGPNDGSVTLTAESVHIDQVTEPLLLMVVGSGSFRATPQWGSLPDAAPVDGGRTGPIDLPLHGGAAGIGNSSVTVEQTPADTTTLGVAGSSLASLESAAESIGRLDLALNRVALYRGSHGAATAHFERSADQMLAHADTLTAAQSRIVDADMARVASERSVALILADIGRAMLAQAHQGPRQVLELLPR